MNKCGFGVSFCDFLESNSLSDLFLDSFLWNQCLRSYVLMGEDTFKDMSFTKSVKESNSLFLLYHSQGQEDSPRTNMKASSWTLKIEKVTHRPEMERGIMELKELIY